MNHATMETASRDAGAPLPPGGPGITLAVTGTDTGVGKTVVTCAIAAAFSRRGLRGGRGGGGVKAVRNGGRRSIRRPRRGAVAGSRHIKRVRVSGRAHDVS